MTPDAFPALDLDRRRPVVESLTEAVVVAKAERRGVPWMADDRYKIRCGRIGVTTVVGLAFTGAAFYLLLGALATE